MSDGVKGPIDPTQDQGCLWGGASPRGVQSGAYHVLAKALPPTLLLQPLFKEAPEPHKHHLHQSHQALSLKEAEGRLLREELSRSMQEREQVRREAQSQCEQAEVSPGAQARPRAPGLAPALPGRCRGPPDAPPSCLIPGTQPPPSWTPSA